MNKSLYKFNLLLVKYTPIVVSLLYMMYYSFVLCEWNVEWMKDIAKVTILPIIYFYASSIVFKFCICHRMFLHYIVFCDIATFYDKYFDRWIGLDWWCTFKIVLGSVLLGILIGHNFRCKHDANYD